MGRRILERHTFPESECGHNFETQKQTLNGDSFEEKIPNGDTIEKKMHLPWDPMCTTTYRKCAQPLSDRKTVGMTVLHGMVDIYNVIPCKLVSDMFA